MARDLGVQHYDVGLSANEPVPPKTIEKIITILRDAPKPLLIHCKSGSDRTGLAAALYRYTIQGKSESEAHQELSLRHGHFPYLISKSWHMDESATAYFETHPHAAGAAR